MPLGGRSHLPPREDSNGRPQNWGSSVPLSQRRLFLLIFAAVLTALLAHDIIDGAIQGIRAALGD